MATIHQVKEYLAFWFQLGKRIVIPPEPEFWLPEPIFQNGQYSLEFEACWRRLMQTDAQDAYLEGTEQTVQQLLEPSWDITACARCAMPVPMISLGVSSGDCPCGDLPSWPNTELPSPRSAINSSRQLAAIRERLHDHELSSD
jgi:hypothetical protein